MEGCGRKIGSFDCCTIVQGDCLDVMAEMPNTCIDLVVTDPPYNVSQSKSFKNADGTFGFKGWTPIREVEWDALPKEKYRTWLRNVMVECHRVLKSIGSMYVIMGTGQLHFLGQVLEELEFSTLNMIAWYQSNKFPNNYGRTRYNPATEMIYFVRKGNKHYFNYTEFMRDMWDIPTVQGNARVHPAQKPNALYDRCLIHSCPTNGLVFDPFIGSGTMAESAEKQGCHFFGCDINPDYVRMAEERLSTVQMSYLT